MTISHKGMTESAVFTVCLLWHLKMLIIEQIVGWLFWNKTMIVPCLASRGVLNEDQANRKSENN